MRFRAATALIALVGLGGCGLSMTQQPKYGPYASATFWGDGAAARPLPQHVVARGDLELETARSNPPAVDQALLKQGRERFGIYCSPCHGLSGEGDGIIVQRGFPRPPSYDEPRLLAAPANHFFDVMTNGYGVMYSYADRIEPHDRWAIVAYIRALQLAGHAGLSDAPKASEKLP